MMNQQIYSSLWFRSATLVISLMMMLPRRSLMVFRSFWVNVSFHLTIRSIDTMFVFLVEFLPQIKNNITEVLKKVPEIQTKISEQVNNIPPKEDIKERVNSLLENLPENEGTSIFKETVNTHIDNLPSNSEINEMIDATVEQIPSADYIHEKLDEFVDQ